MLVVTQVLQTTTSAWKNTSEKINSFRNARAAFDSLTTQLRQATLNTYLDYFNAAGQTSYNYYKANAASTNIFIPAAYGRQSELHFICGPGLVPGQVTHSVFFQCPLGITGESNYSQLNGMLNVSGFYVTFGSDGDMMNRPPAFLSAPPVYGYRLMQFVQKSEALQVYALPDDKGWFTLPLQNPAANVRMLADNILALIILPELAADKPTQLTSDYRYDSRNKSGDRTANTAIAYDWTPGTMAQPLPMNQMPPLLRVVMVALDENSAIRLQGSSTSAPTQITSAMAGKFTDPALLDSDLQALGSALTTLRLNYRVFSTTIAVRSAKFSDQ
jgi:uncharacterized protein (TIGR02599 family)